MEDDIDTHAGFDYIIEVADVALNTLCSQRSDDGIVVARENADLVAAAEQHVNDGAAEKAAAACDESFHSVDCGLHLLVVHEGSDCGLAATMPTVGLRRI